MRRRLYLPWTFVLPIVALIGLATFFIAKQLIAKWFYGREIDQLIAANQPVDDASLRAQYFRSTSRAQTTKRVKVEHAIETQSHVAVISLWPDEQFQHQPLRRPLVPQGEPWPERVLFQHYVTQQQATLAELATLAKSAEPTWRSLSLSRYDSMLLPYGWPRSETTLLDAEFRLAFHDHDSARAMRALVVHDTTITARNWQVNIGEDLHQIVAHHVLYGRIIQSLSSHTFWSAEQRVRLEEFLRVQTPLAERWRRVLAGERAMSLGAIDASAGSMIGMVRDLPFISPLLDANQRMIPAKSLVRFVRLLNELPALADQGYPGLIARAQSAADWSAGDMMGWFPFDSRNKNHQGNVESLRALTPAVGTFAACLVDLEDTRRLAKIALGLRRYAIAKDRWPVTLSQLQEFGVGVDELRTADGIEYVMQQTDESIVTIDLNLKILGSLQMKLEN